MQANGFFEGIGEAIGDAIRVVVEFLVGLFTNFFGAFDDFIGGLTRSLGINDSFLSLAIGNTGNTTANNCNALHESLHRLYERRAIPPANMFARRTPSVMEPERFTPMMWRLLLRWAE